jgi:hypothetical protein
MKLSEEHIHTLIIFIKPILFQTVLPPEDPLEDEPKRMPKGSPDQLVYSHWYLRPGPSRRHGTTAFQACFPSNVDQAIDGA